MKSDDEMQEMKNIIINKIQNSTIISCDFESEIIETYPDEQNNRQYKKIGETITIKIVKDKEGISK